MLVGELPAALREIHDDGRSNGEIFDALESNGIAIFRKDVFAKTTEPIPVPGTRYNFLGILACDLPEALRSSARRIVAAADDCGRLRKPSVRAALLLMERMKAARLYAEMVIMNEPVLSDSGDSLLVHLGYENDCGQPWISVVDADHVLFHEHELVVFLAQRGTAINLHC